MVNVVIVNNQNAVLLWPQVHLLKYTIDEIKELVTVKGASHDCTKQNAIKAEHRKNGKPLDSHLCMDGIVGAYSPLTTDKVGCDKMKWTPASLKRPSISKSLILLIGQAQSYAYGTVVEHFC